MPEPGREGSRTEDGLDLWASSSPEAEDRPGREDRREVAEGARGCCAGGKEHVMKTRQAGTLEHAQEESRR